MSPENNYSSTRFTTSGTSQKRDVTEFDFRQPKLVSKEIMRTLRNIHEMLAKSLSRIFTNVLSSRTEVEQVSIDQVLFSDFMHYREPPRSFYLFQIKKMGDWGIVELDPSFCLYLVERQSGGKGTLQEDPRTLTRIEEKIIMRTLSKFVEELQKAWGQYMEFEVDKQLYESKPENIHGFSSYDQSIIIRLKLHMIDGDESTIRICYPYALLKQPMERALQSQHEGAEVQRTEDEQRAFEEHVKGTPTTVEVILGTTKIKMRDLLRLREGDAVKLNQPTDEPLKVQVNGKVKMHGFPGNYNKHRAVKIFEMLDDQSNDQSS